MASENYDVFVSYSRADWRHATEIDSALRAKGLRSFFDRRNLAPGLPWVRALEQAIGAAKAVIVLIGPRGLGNTQQYERELAIVRQSRDPAFPVVPVILPETASRSTVRFSQTSSPGSISPTSRKCRMRRTSLRASWRPSAARRRLGTWCGKPSALTAGSTPSGRRTPRSSSAAAAPSDPESPIGQLVRKVREHPFVMVVGRSGSGKSSLVYAGLLPALRRERDRFWNVLSLRPGPTPLRALAAAFNPRADDRGRGRIRHENHHRGGPAEDG